MANHIKETKQGIKFSKKFLNRVIGTEPNRELLGKFQERLEAIADYRWDVRSADIPVTNPFGPEISALKEVAKSLQAIVDREIEMVERGCHNENAKRADLISDIAKYATDIRKTVAKYEGELQKFDSLFNKG